MNRDRDKLAKVLRQVAEAEGLNGLPTDDVALAESLSLSLLGDDHGPTKSDVISRLIEALGIKLLTEEYRDESVLVRELRRLLEEEERRTYALERLTQQQAESADKFEVELAHQKSLLAAARARCLVLTCVSTTPSHRRWWGCTASSSPAHVSTIC